MGCVLVAMKPGFKSLEPFVKNAVFLTKTDSKETRLAAEES